MHQICIDSDWMHCSKQTEQDREIRQRNDSNHVYCQSHQSLWWRLSNDNCLHQKCSCVRMVLCFSSDVQKEHSQTIDRLQVEILRQAFWIKISKFLIHLWLNSTGSATLPSPVNIILQYRLPFLQNSSWSLWSQKLLIPVVFVQTVFPHPSFCAIYRETSHT